MGNHLGPAVTVSKLRLVYQSKQRLLNENNNVLSEQQGFHFVAKTELVGAFIAQVKHLIIHQMSICLSHHPSIHLKS